MLKSARFGLWMLPGLVVLSGFLYLLLPVDGSEPGRDEPEIISLSSRWVTAVASRSPSFVDLLSTSSASYYEEIRDVALQGGASELNALKPTDQLQALFLRLTIDPGKLRQMSGRELVTRAVAEGWIGQDLRRTDELREVSLQGDTATGRLYKFGQDDRPDRGRQHFVREGGEWRVDLRGERERLEMDFKSFVARSGLSPSEAAFFILETRLLRKVVPADFLPPASEPGTKMGEASVPEVGNPGAHLRLVAIRESPDDPSLRAATIEDRKESLRSVLQAGESFGAENELRVVRVENDRAWLERDGESLVLRLEREGPPLDQRLRLSGDPAVTVSLLEQARLGEYREGMMAQWRNVGLRGRPQLLQQAWLVPEVPPGHEGMLGLRVRKLVDGSFWHQLGLAEGDLLESVNGNAIDSMDHWQALVRTAEKDQDISLVLRRDGRTLRFHTQTVPPT